MSKKTVVAVRENGREKVFGPYPPMKARELKEAYRRDLANDRRNTDIPDDTDRIETRPAGSIEESDK